MAGACGQSACLLESGERGAELVHGGVGDGLADRLVDLLAHVRRQLVHRAGRRACRTTSAGPPGIWVDKPLLHSKHDSHTTTLSTH